jgi:hypothetical protein
VAQLRKATWEYKLLVIKGQHELEPKRGWELLQQLDPNSVKLDNTTFARAFYPKDAIVVSAKRDIINTTKPGEVLIDP